jgi:hypothetical protein
MNTEDVEVRRTMPSRRGYVIAAVIAAVGLVFGLGGLARGISDLSAEVDAFDRVDVPGQGAIRFETPGNYTLYYESAVANVVPPFRAVLEGPDGEPVELTAYEGSFDYTVGGHNGTAVATFRIETPGTYDLHAMGSVPAGSGQLAVGKGLGGHLARTLVPGLILFVAMVAAAVLAIVTAVRRRRSRRQQALSAAG